MSDVSKTNELIAELRERAERAGTNVAQCMREAADALESATRVPVQGEPNDDREALRKEFEYRIRTAVAYGSGLGYRELPVQERADWIQREIRNAVAIASRATVPDAATEEAFKKAVAFDKAVALSERRQTLLEEAETERDAALASIERVRVEHGKEPVNSNYGGTHDICLACEQLWPCPTIAALDGAPEPETAPENYEPKCNGACVVHGSPVTNWPVQYGRRNRETGALHWLKGDPLDSWWHENQDNYEHVKRYTSPPLPVEGESK